MQYGFIYETTNLCNGMKYIGQHKRSQNINDPDDSWYLGSGTYLRNALTYYGLENFSRRIIEDCDSDEELNIKEEYYLSLYDCANNPEYYNMTNSSTKKWPILEGENNPNYGGKSFTPEVCKQISETKKENYAKGITVAWNKGKQMPEEFCEKISDTWDYDKHYGEETTTRETMSKTMKEKVARGEWVNPISLPGVREKIGESMREGYASGRHKKLYGDDNPARRPEVRQKMSKSAKEAMNRPEVHAKSLANGERLRNDPEFSKKISEGRIGEKNPCYNKIWINNGEINYRVTKEEFIEIYESQGFKEGRLCKPYGKRK